ncbi:hypothetical protein [Kutzneria buriramensis]|uniref:Uncharacterized protein n=1 Tax=Kutzneria buriramensis TaxID=1045776 RepID=A0A3E0HLJ2_9PSEU|nr:hypothetical protein [Kutzneria buriramensis]REH47343.1 hypothetical protein BCF44_106508 [Kutzneria buriramensis]
MSLLLHVIPVGLSLDMQVTQKRIVHGADRQLLARTLTPRMLGTRGGPANPVRAALRQATAGPDDPADGPLDAATLLGPARDLVSALRAHPQLCAEWTSVHAELDAQPAGDPHQGHAYLVLASDTAEGLRTATLVAHGLAEATPVRYTDDPGTTPFRRGLIRPGEVVLCRIPGLDFADEHGLGAATWDALGAIGNVAAASALNPALAARWRVVLHLSGGYKALIPYLLVMAEAMNSVFHDPERGGEHPPVIEAVMLQEYSEGRRLAVPVRSFQNALYAELVALARHARAGTLASITSGSLLGLCLDQHKQLTPMGRIMVAVL